MGKKTFKVGKYKVREPLPEKEKHKLYIERLFERENASRGEGYALMLKNERLRRLCEEGMTYPDWKAEDLDVYIKVDEESSKKMESKIVDLSVFELRPKGTPDEEDIITFETFMKRVQEQRDKLRNLMEVWEKRKRNLKDLASERSRPVELTSLDSEVKE